MNTPWIEKYRPNKLDEVISQNFIVRTLKKLINNNKFPNLIFYGLPGTGKTSTITSCAKEIYGSKYNIMVLELNGSDDRGINVIRNKINDFCKYKNFFSNKIKLIILDEADSMTEDAQFALRKFIEKYSENVRFCLICNYIYKIIKSLQSRCITLKFDNISHDNIKQKLIEIADKEKLKYDDEGIESIIKLCNGDLRKAINYLQSLSLNVNKINEKNIIKNTGYISDSLINDIIAILLNNNFKKTYTKLSNLIDKNNICFHDLIRQSFKFINKLELNDIQLSEFIKDMTNIEYNLLKGGDIDIQLGALISCFFKIRYL